MHRLPKWSKWHIHEALSPNSITLTWTQITKVRDANHVANFHDLCHGLSWFVSATKSDDLSWTLSPNFPVHCNGLNSIRATQMDLSRTCHGPCCKHINMSRWFVSATFVIGVSDFHRNLSFHDLSPFVSATFMICVHDLCPAKKFRWKSA